MECICCRCGYDRNDAFTCLLSYLDFDCAILEHIHIRLNFRYHRHVQRMKTAQVLFTVCLVAGSVLFSPATNAEEPKCDKNFYGFDKASESSKKCAAANLKNIKWPIGSTALCKDGSFSFSKNKKSMCLKGKGVAKYRT